MPGLGAAAGGGGRRWLGRGAGRVSGGWRRRGATGRLRVRSGCAERRSAEAVCRGCRAAIPAARAVAAAAEPAEGAGGDVPLRPGSRPRLLGCPPSGLAAGRPVRGSAVLPARASGGGLCPCEGPERCRSRRQTVQSASAALLRNGGCPRALLRVPLTPETGRLLKLLRFKSIVESVLSSGSCALTHLLRVVS